MSKWTYETYYYKLTLWDKIKLWCQFKSTKGLIKFEKIGTCKIDFNV
jgi:hypothetical protein